MRSFDYRNIFGGHVSAWWPGEYDYYTLGGGFQAQFGDGTYGAKLELRVFGGVTIGCWVNTKREYWRKRSTT